VATKDRAADASAGGKYQFDKARNQIIVSKVQTLRVDTTDGKKVLDKDNAELQKLLYVDGDQNKGYRFSSKMRIPSLNLANCTTIDGLVEEFRALLENIQSHDDAGTLVSVDGSASRPRGEFVIAQRAGLKGEPDTVKLGVVPWMASEINKAVTLSVQKQLYGPNMAKATATIMAEQGWTAPISKTKTVKEAKATAQTDNFV
jgi:hypothetical protein